MKSMKIIILLVIIFSFGINPNDMFSQKKPSRDIVIKAMKDELDRNISKLSLEKLKSPFFISYNIHNLKVMTIKASLGAIINSDEKPYQKVDTRVIIGDYNRTQENFFNMGGGGSMYGGGDALPIENDYDGIRRVLWKSTDEIYKDAAEVYEKKLSALTQQKLSEEELALKDFSTAPMVKQVLPPNEFPFEKTKWENIAKEFSAIFNKYSDIFQSEVTITFIQGDEFFVNSEGTQTIYPITLAAIQANAYALAEDGEPLFDQCLYFEDSPNSLPKIENMTNDIRKMADNLATLRKAKSFNDTYTGPVLFEDEAVGELISQRFFAGSEGLIAMRKPIFGDPQMLMFASQMLGKSLEDKIGKKIFSDNLTVKAIPQRAEFNGKKLIGSYQVDMEGFVPPNELTLINKGMLMTLLNGRIPILKIDNSNGHKRIEFKGSSVGDEIGPGVIEVTSSNTSPKADLKKKLIDAAKEKGLDYAIIVRKLKSPVSGIKTKFDPSSMMAMMGGGEKKANVTKPIAIYKVSLTDGKEELIRTAELGGISLSSLKKITSVSENQFVYNTLVSKGGAAGGLMGMVFMFMSEGDSDWNLNGIPSSFIVPDGLIIDELDVQKEKRLMTGKLPVVENPVGKK